MASSSSAVGHPCYIQQDIDPIAYLRSIRGPIRSRESRLAEKELLSNCQCKMERLSLDSPSVKHYKVNFPDDFSKIDTTIYEILENVVVFGCYYMQVVIFVPTIEVAQMLRATLLEHDFHFQMIHADVTGKDRDSIVRHFNTRFYQVLITPDALLPPEVDQSMVSVVINWEMPKKDQEPDVALYSQRLCPKGAVFSFLCGESENMVMKKFESRFSSKVSEVSSWESSADFTMALEEAGLVN